MKFLARKDKKDANTQTYIAIKDLEVSRPQGREGRLFDLVILSLFLHSGGSVHEMTQAFIERGPGIAEALFIYPLLLNKKRDVLSAHALEGIVEQRLEDAMNAYQEDLTAIELDLPLSHFRRKVLEGGEVAIGESLVEFWDGMFDADRARHAEQQLGIKKIALVPMLVEGEPYGVVVFAFDKTDIDAEIVELLVTTFHELRESKTGDGKALEPLSTAMSTAEAVSTAYAAGIHAYYYGQGDVQPEHLVQHLVGSALKDSPDDIKKLEHYFNHVVKGRKGPHWRGYYEARKQLP